MALTAAQFDALRASMQLLHERQRQVDRLRLDLVAFKTGSPMSKDLAELARPRVGNVLTNRLDTLQTDIDAEAAAIRATVSDYDPKAGV